MFHGKEAGEQNEREYFLIIAVTQLCRSLYTYKQLFAQLILGPVIAPEWLQVTCSNQ